MIIEKIGLETKAQLKQKTEEISTLKQIIQSKDELLKNHNQESQKMKKQYDDLQKKHQALLQSYNDKTLQKIKSVTVFGIQACHLSLGAANNAHL